MRGIWREGKDGFKLKALWYAEASNECSKKPNRVHFPDALFISDQIDAIRENV